MIKVPHDAQLERLRRLAELPDEQIDTSDMPIVEDWSDGVRGGTPADVRRKLKAEQASVAKAAGPATQTSRNRPRRRETQSGQPVRSAVAR